MANNKRDANRVGTMLVLSNDDGVTPIVLYADPTTHRLVTAASSGTLNARTDARRDDNRVPNLLAVSSSDGVTPVTLMADSVTHGLFTQ